MDMDMLSRLLRQVLQFAAGLLVSHGLMTESGAQTLIGVVGAAVIAGYVAYRNTKQARIADVAKLPEVSVVATTPALAQAIPDPAVVSREAVKVAGRSIMSHGWLGALLAMTLALAGCAQMTTVSPAASNAALQSAVVAARIVAPSSVAKLDKTIAQVAGSPTLAKSCNVFAVAAGYYDALRAAIPAKYAAVGDVAARAGSDLCASPPADTAQALATLNRLWAGVQASTVTR